MSIHDKTYQAQVEHVIEHGEYSENRTAVNTIKEFGDMRKYNIAEHGFAAITSKFVSMPNVAKELCWIYRGGTNVKELQENNCNIWNEWANGEGYLGPVYGAMMRHWEDVRIVDIRTENGKREASMLIEKGYQKVGDLTQTISGLAAFEQEMLKGNIDESFINALRDLDECIFVGDSETTPHQEQIQNTFPLQVDANVVLYIKDDAIAGVMGIMAGAMNIELDELLATKSVYVKQVDQLDDKVNDLIARPSDRRLLISMYNPAKAPFADRLLTTHERYEHYIWEQIQKLEADEKWMDKALDRHSAGDTPPTIQARDFAESELRSTPDVDWDDDEDINKLLDHLKVPRSTKLEPKENADYNQQALPPCHMVFQLATRRMNTAQRLNAAVNKVFERYLLDHIENHPDVESIRVYHKNGDYTYEIADNLINDLREMATNLVNDSIRASISQESYFEKAGIPEYFLDQILYQRSADLFLGVPYNISSYCMNMIAIGKKANMMPRMFTHMVGDYHIYENHLNQFREQFERETYDSPIVLVKDFDKFEELSHEDFIVVNYKHGGALRGKVAV